MVENASKLGYLISLTTGSNFKQEAPIQITSNSKSVLLLKVFTKVRNCLQALDLNINLNSKRTEGYFCRLE